MYTKHLRLLLFDYKLDNNDSAEESVNSTN